MTDEIFQTMLNRFSSPEVQKCINHVESIAGYKLKQTEKQPFLKFHSSITNPEPKFISEWRSNVNLEKWYHRFVNGILGDVQNAYTCVKYHFDNLNIIEESIIKGLSELNFKMIMDNSSISIGNTLKWDFEYQAFILAYRRCLDYLAKGIAAYFKNDFHSFRDLGNFLEKQRDQKRILEQLVNVHKKYSASFQFVLSDGNRKSTRDRINHYAYVSVGVLNINGRGPVLVGGEEKLNGTGQTVLSDVLLNYKNQSDSCVYEMISLLVDLIKEN